MSVEDIGGRVSWREAVGLMRALLCDPSTRTSAAVLGWERPVDTAWYLGRILAQVASALGSDVDWPRATPAAAGPADPAEVARARALLAAHTAIPG